MNKNDKFRFLPENLKQAEFIIKKYPKGKQASAVMPLLDLAQRQNNNWLTPEAIEYVATILDMPTIRVFEVATFYSMFNLSPVGKFHVQVCTNLPCWLRGSENIVSVCKKELAIDIGEVSNDGRFSLVEVECLGACVNAPMMQINDNYFEDLDTKSTQKILSNIKNGKKNKFGTQQKRYTCEPYSGLTSLISQQKLRDRFLKD